MKGSSAVQALRVAGVDEAGRGCLAGPVHAAAVILPGRHRLRGLDDSKNLTAAAREALFEPICRCAIAWSVASASHDEIDRLNILQASLLAMRRALDALHPAAEHCLIDGNRLPAGLRCTAEAVIGGDGLHACIMAASILAKVSRDREMQRLCEIHPGYNFRRHKGYGTPEHLHALRRLGPSPIHRMSFAPCAQRPLPLLPAAAMPP